MPIKTDEHTNKASSFQHEKNQAGICKSSVKRFRAGMTCPRCNAARLDYNGLLQLACPQCGVIETGVFT